ncbi:MAG TPA: sirohydrochlorin chelatase [Actinomycetales bacterium]|jgi:sirohydrochlorin cobaltochelatase
MSAPLLVVGHGTKDPAGVAGFLALVERARRRLAVQGVGAEGGFIELSAPALTQAVEALWDGGHRRVAAVPLVLVGAGHAKGDIPGAMAREMVRRPGLSYSYGRPLGPHPILLDLLAQRVDEALAGAPREGTTVLLVGRGSSDPDANAEVVKTARLLWEGRGYEGVETCFVSLAAPSVPAGLERARLLGARRVVVAPYFLFRGVLPDRVDAQVLAWAADHPEVDVRVGAVLGDCDPLADLVLERYRESLAGDLRMNCDTCVYRTAMPGFERQVGAPQTPHDHPDDPTGAHGHGHGHGHGHEA